MPANILIQDTDTRLRISGPSGVRSIAKSTIVDVTVIKGSILKIDIGQGPLHNIFIPHADVLHPAFATAMDLRDAIESMCELPQPSGGTAGGATEANQATEINYLNAINTAMGSLTTLVNTIDGKLFYEPKMVDDAGAGVIYNGFTTQEGARAYDPVWAIQRIAVDDHGVHVYTWANGNKNFDKLWTERESMTYL